MSLRVGQRVKTIDGREGVVESVNLWRSDRFESIRDILTVRVDGIGDVYLSHQLTPMAEPARAKGWCNKPEGQKCVDEPASSYCDMALRCGWWVRPPAPHSYASRLSLIAYPELFICSKAGECKATGCVHRAAHSSGKYATCAEMASACESRCIPYVPEDEAREWFIVSGPKPVVLYDSNLTKGKADYIVQHWKGAEYRAFKWSDGLKGGE
jgi:hypothetical protein